MTKVYWPELGDSMPECQITARICYYPRGHYHLETHLDLKGQGIRYDWNVNADENQPKIYVVTKRAYDRLKKKYTIAWEGELT